MFYQPTLPLIFSTTSSPESEAGHTPSASPGGLTIDLSGQEAVPVNLSARQAREQELLTSGTCGLRGFGSSASVALEQSLANRFRQEGVLSGGTLWRLTWKTSSTPAQRSIYRLRASARSTDDRDSIGWHTPQVVDATGTGRAGRLKKDHNRDPSKLGNYRRDLKDDVLLTVWATPAARDYRDGRASLGTMGRNSRPLNEQAAFGLTLSGSTAGMEKSVRLNPEFTRWLMGFPEEWGSCADMVTR